MCKLFSNLHTLFYILDWFISIVDISIDYLQYSENEDSAWINNNDYTADIVNVLEYVNDNISGLSISQKERLFNMILNSSDYVSNKDYINIDEFSHYLLIDELLAPYELDYIISSQNPDGGFGLTEGYASDIIDTKLALKALADLDETEAMTNAAMYIASLQNADGGFSYQQGLASNPELTAEIADIFGDCIIKDQLSDYVLKI